MIFPPCYFSASPLTLFAGMEYSLDLAVLLNTILAQPFSDTSHPGLRHSFAFGVLYYLLLRCGRFRGVARASAAVRRRLQALLRRGRSWLTAKWSGLRLPWKEDPNPTGLPQYDNPAQRPVPSIEEVRQRAAEAARLRQFKRW